MPFRCKQANAITASGWCVYMSLPQPLAPFPPFPTLFFPAFPAFGVGSYCIWSWQKRTEPFVAQAHPFLDFSSD